MYRFVTSTAVLALLAGAAIAQTSPSPQPGSPPPVQPEAPRSTSSPTTTGSTSATNEITPQEKAAIQGQITKDAHPSSSAPSGVAPAEGATLPQAVIIHAIPVEVAGGQGLSYAVIGDKAFVVDPERKVVGIIEMK